MTETVPRVASSLDDLRVGQVVAYRDHRGDWYGPEVLRGSAGWDKYLPVFILEDVPPELVTVSREAFDRLRIAADDRVVMGWEWFDRLRSAVDALVDEVRGQTDVG